MSADLVISQGRVIPASTLDVKTARSGGPGGQHVNRTETKVQLTLDPRAVPWIDEGMRLRIVALAGRNVDREGRVYVVSQEHREKERNLEDARTKLAALLEKALLRPKKRIKTKPSKAAKRRRLDEKRRQSTKKEARGRVRDD